MRAGGSDELLEGLYVLVQGGLAGVRQLQTGLGAASSGNFADGDIVTRGEAGQMLRKVGLGQGAELLNGFEADFVTTGQVGADPKSHQGPKSVIQAASHTRR